MLILSIDEIQSKQTPNNINSDRDTVFNYLLERRLVKVSDCPSNLTFTRVENYISQATWDKCYLVTYHGPLIHGRNPIRRPLIAIVNDD